MHDLPRQSCVIRLKNANMLNISYAYSCRLHLDSTYATVLLLLGRHGVSPEEQRHAMAQLAEVQIVVPASVSPEAIDIEGMKL